MRPLKVSIHRPNFESDCYSLGRSWRHRSDAHGWRNPETWESADVVLIADGRVDEDIDNRDVLHRVRGVAIEAGDFREFFLDAWFDWNANGIFEVSEREQWGSAGSGRSSRSLTRSICWTASIYISFPR